MRIGLIVDSFVRTVVRRQALGAAAWAHLILACVALDALSACDTDATLQLFPVVVPVAVSDGGAAGGSSDVDAGEPIEAGAAGASPGVPCRKLGNEVCNGGDDDCNGGIDEGCGYTITWSSVPDGAALGTGPNDVPFDEPCPDGSVLVGLRAGFGNWLNQISAVCGQLQMTADTTGGTANFNLAFGPRFNKPLVPASPEDPNSKVQPLTCPTGLLASGFDGQTDAQPAHHILAIRVRCAPPIVNSDGSRPVIALDQSQETSLGPLVCATCSVPTTYGFESSVPSGQVATGVFGAAGIWAGRVGYDTATATITSR